jgi:signal transduction histidine kinase
VGPLELQNTLINEGEITALEPVPILINPGSASITEAKQKFNLTGIIILAVVSMAGMVLVYTVAGKALSPIHDLSETISVITENNLQMRIPEEGRSDEIGALGHSFNIMLERLQKSFMQQKRFSVNVAHELKTPLSTIRAGIQVLNLENSPSIEDYEETLLTTERNLNRLTAIVDDLMRLCDEQELFDTTNIELEEMFAAICHELQPIFEEKDIEIVTKCKLQAVRGNQGLIYRACFNLIENAAKYNKKNGKIEIETKSGNGLGEIKITDTGSGIPSDELEQIFEPFYRVNKSRSRKTGGAGLGLSIVKTIIERHGWKIAVDSVLGQGTIFTITFTA